MGKLPRDWNAVAAKFRNSGGAMRDRRAPRGGARNEQAEFLAEADEDEAPEPFWAEADEED